jgi:hypothetical protein
LMPVLMPIDLVSKKVQTVPEDVLKDLILFLYKRIPCSRKPSVLKCPPEWRVEPQPCALQTRICVSIVCRRMH